MRKPAKPVSNKDGEKLDEYLTSVRDVEKKLARRRDWLDKPFKRTRLQNTPRKMWPAHDDPKRGSDVGSYGSGHQE